MGGGACERLGQGHGRVEGDAADQRVGAIDCADLGQGTLGCCATVHHRHGAEIHGFGELIGDAFEISAFILAGEAVGELGLGIAAEDGGAFALEAFLNGGLHGADGGDGRDAKGEAGEEHAEAAQAAAQFAPCETGGEGEAHSAAPFSASGSIRPSRRRITRSQRAASSGACVTMISVAPWRS